MKAKSHVTRNNKLCPTLSNKTPKTTLSGVKIAMYLWRNRFSFSNTQRPSFYYFSVLNKMLNLIKDFINQGKILKYKTV
jgi:hypothetical protein